MYGSSAKLAGDGEPEKDKNTQRLPRHKSQDSLSRHRSSEQVDGLQGMGCEGMKLYRSRSCF